MPEPGTHAIAVAEEQPIARGALERAFLGDARFRWVGAARDAFELSDLCQGQHPDLVALSASTPGYDFPTTLAVLRRQFPTLPLVVLTDGEDPFRAARYRRAGARACLAKRLPVRVLLDAIADVMEPANQPNAVQWPAEDELPEKRLTRRELEIFRLFGAGLRTGEIASRTDLSPKTVGTHLERIRRKTGLQTDFQIIAYCTGSREVALFGPQRP